MIVKAYNVRVINEYGFIEKTYKSINETTLERVVKDLIQNGYYCTFTKTDFQVYHKDKEENNDIIIIETYHFRKVVS